MRHKLAAGNWKMNGLSGDLAEIEALIAAHPAPKVEMLICPPATLLSRMADTVGDHPLHLGGQDCHAAPDGANTGDISAAMLVDAGARYVILGHSERRTDHGAEWPAHGEARHPAQHLAPETQTASCMAKPNRFLSRKPSQPVDALPGPARQASGVKDQAPWQWPRTGKTPWPHPPRAGQTAARPLACPYRWPSQPAALPPARPAPWLE